MDTKLKLYNQTMRKFISMYDPNQYDHNMELINLSKKFLNEKESMADKIVQPLMKLT